MIKSANRLCIYSRQFNSMAYESIIERVCGHPQQRTTSPIPGFWQCNFSCRLVDSTKTNSNYFSHAHVEQPTDPSSLVLPLCDATVSQHDQTMAKVLQRTNIKLRVDKEMRYVIPFPPRIGGLLMRLTCPAAAY